MDASSSDRRVGVLEHRGYYIHAYSHGQRAPHRDACRAGALLSTVAVTGGSGFVGGLILRSLVANGHRVISLGRRATGGEHRAYSLETPSEDGLLDEVEIVIHCAWDLTITDVGAIESVNVQGTERLVKDAEHSHARVVFISSMSAYDGTKQIYGRAKLRCERVVLERGGEAVRLGLVWGGDEGGMIATLRRLSRLPVLPLLGPDLRQFTVHADDVGAGLLKLVERPCSEPLGLAHPVPVPFELIMSELRGGGRPRMVRVPWAPVYGALIAGERLGIPLPVRADSLLGLVRPAPEVPGVAYWSEVGLRLRPFPGVRA